VRGEWSALRRRAASVRARLLEAAAQRWHVAREQCRARHGEVIDPRGGASLTYAELAHDAARMRAPRDVEIKSPGEFRIVGQAVPRLDLPDMVAGRTRYAIDLELPGLRVAAIARCPTFGGAAARVDDAHARRVPGVVAVEVIDAGVAVVADCAWNALRGRDALQVTWNPPDNPRVNNGTLADALAHAAHAKGKLAEHHGDARRAIERTPRVIEADYRTPYLAHVPMEPPNCIAWVRDGECDVWVGTQSQVDSHAVAARASGLPRGKVRIHTQFMGGGFGRRLRTDFVEEAVQLSRRIEAPVQTIWSRADDVQHGFYRPMAHVYLRAALEADGRPGAWWMRVAGCDMALDGTTVPYAIENFREEHCEVDSPLPVGPWRSVGASQHCFAIEGFVDELAHAAGRDPIDYRRALLASEPRLVGVLDAVRAASGWRANSAPGTGYGVALFHGFGSYCALVAEVDTSLASPVRRITCALDCGFAVNPDIVRAQVEGGVVFGLSAALHEELRVDSGRVVQATFRDYPILTYAQTPEIAVQLIADSAEPGGVGEPPVPPVAPAVANAWFAATGQRKRSLPLRLAQSQQPTKENFA
jgi:isoquinoline 1-oxidoreductase beta subunit